MTRITWNATGEKFYETGISEAVLYVDGLAPAPWNGLLSVSESAIGGDAVGYYYDGIKYLNNANNQEFKAVIKSYYVPEEFYECDGQKQLTYYGLFATQQARKTFNLCYKTQIGNDIDGQDHAYKLHLIYNAIATPTVRTYGSIDANGEPSVQSWSISALPQAIAGFKPTPYRVVDSRKYSTLVMSTLDEILYGSPSATPRFPTMTELTTILGA